MNKKIEAIVFDLDGTLINTIPDVIHALNHTLVSFGQTKIQADEIFGLIGNGADHLIRNAFKKYDVELAEEELKSALDTYITYYSAHPIVDTKIYPDVVATLKQFKDDGIDLGICTNKSGSITRLVLEKLALTDLFSAISCGDEVSHPKPHAKHLFAVLNSMNADAARCVYIGDSEVDRMTAVNADVTFIGVTYGYELNAKSSENMINHFHELPAALRSLSTQEKSL
jgi:phosphoglycolate phosphatase